MDISEAIHSSFPIFKEEGLIQQILDTGKIAQIKAGTEILSEGIYVKTVPFLVDGLVKVVRERDSKEFLLYYIYLEESCIVSINCGIKEIKSNVKAIAEEDSTALLIPARLIEEWQRKYRSFNNFIFDLQQKRFEDVLQAFNTVAFDSLDRRIMDYLKARVKVLKSNKIQMTHQELSDDLGSSRETISRILKKLEAEGVVSLRRGIIEVSET